jgi:hypothetical protein
MVFNHATFGPSFLVSLPPPPFVQRAALSNP